MVRKKKYHQENAMNYGAVETQVRWGKKVSLYDVTIMSKRL